jgi:quaternary ammonium compound-resistance protein SugE
VDWIILIFAGLFEVGFTTSMKLSDDFSKVWPTLSFVACAIVSFSLLNRSTRTIPLGTAYAVWTGIGAFGTAAIGIAFFKDPLTFWRVAFLTGLLGCILGLKLVAAH